MDKYTFGFKYKVNGRDSGTVVTLDPTPALDTFAAITYFRMTIEQNNTTTVLPIQEDQIVLIEQAIADFRRGVKGLDTNFHT